MVVNLPTIEVSLLEYGKDRDGWERNKWQVTLDYNGRQFQTEYNTGMAWKQDEITAETVLQSLFSDIESVEFVDVDGWVEDMGIEINSLADARHWEQAYQGIERQAVKLREFLGDDYDSIREAVRED